MVAAQPQPTPDPRRLLGQVLVGRYRINEFIGERGVSAVYWAEHQTLNRRVVIKVIHPEVIGVTEGVARFEREALAGAQLRHPNVAAAMDFGTLEDGSHFLVLEHLEGEDLRSVIGRGPLSPIRALRIARQIALALDTAHQLGIVHRDLKPESVMLVLREQGEELVKVLDFGLAKVPDLAIAARTSSVAARTQDGPAAGTPEYMAPEQAAGPDVDGRADLYSVGVIMYEMLSGRRPFDAQDRAELIAMVTSTPPPKLGSRVPDGALPSSLEALVMRLLEKAPGNRIPSGGQIVTAIDAILFPGPQLVVDRQASASAPTAINMAALRRRAASARDTIVATFGGGEAPPKAPAPVTTTPEKRDAARAMEPSRAASRPTSLAWLGLAAITAMIVIAILVRNPKTVEALEAAEGDPRASPSSSASAEPSSAPDPHGETSETAPAAELDAARLAGLSALGPLAMRYPNDPAVLKALMLAHATAKSGYAAALGVAKQLFERSPKTAGDDDMRNLLLRIANGRTDVATLALEAMAGKMGTFGPDMLHDIANNPSMGRFPRDRAAKLLATAEVRKIASPALVIAMDLKPLNPCGRKALFARARADGDARSLPFLKPLVLTDGCSRMVVVKFDCYPCLGNRAELNEAIQAIEERGSQR